MKRSLSDLLSYDLMTKDGIKANIKDILFDQDAWIIRYLEVDFGTLFIDKRVLVPRFFLKDTHMASGKFYIDLNRETIEMCPRPEEHMTVSRKYEEELNRYYRLNNYWDQPYVMPNAALISTAYSMRIPPPAVDEKNIDSRLRSFKEVNGYGILAIDGNFGHIDDLIMDDVGWKISYMVIDTSKWLPWGKKVLVDISWIESISYQNSEAKINLYMEPIKSAPEFDPSVPIDDQFEHAMHLYYERNMVR